MPNAYNSTCFATTPLCLHLWILQLKTKTPKKNAMFGVWIQFHGVIISLTVHLSAELFWLHYIYRWDDIRGCQFYNQNLGISFSSSQANSYLLYI